MKGFGNIPILCILILLSFSCYRNHYIGNSVQYYSIAKERQSDRAISNTIAPYKRQLDSEMNRIIGKNDVLLTKEQPESSLGNWAADAIHAQCELYSNANADFAILNYGGLRISSIPQGDITKGKVFELMPFDNMLVVVNMKGDEIKAVFEHAAAKGGWPVSSAIRMKMSANGQLLAVKINGQDIDNNKTYKVATIDYLANGGDNCTFFVGKTRTETGRFMRDAAIEYIEKLSEKGTSIKSVKEGRVVLEK